MLDIKSPEDQYNEQRYERLEEILDEYLGCSGKDVGAGALFRDIQKACIELKHYHQECLDGFTIVEDYFK